MHAHYVIATSRAPTESRSPTPRQPVERQFMSLPQNRPPQLRSMVGACRCILVITMTATLVGLFIAEVRPLRPSISTRRCRACLWPISWRERSFESGNGELTFDDFEAKTSGIAAPSRLDLYWVKPAKDGFHLFTPLSRPAWATTRFAHTRLFSRGRGRSPQIEAVTALVHGSGLRTARPIPGWTCTTAQTENRLAELQVGASGFWPFQASRETEARPRADLSKAVAELLVREHDRGAGADMFASQPDRQPALRERFILPSLAPALLLAPRPCGPGDLPVPPGHQLAWPTSIRRGSRPGR